MNVESWIVKGCRLDGNNLHIFAEPGDRNPHKRELKLFLSLTDSDLDKLAPEITARKIKAKASETANAELEKLKVELESEFEAKRQSVARKYGIRVDEIYGRLYL